MAEKVELLPAYHWDCPECGVQNFARGLVPELTEEETEELRSEHGVELWEQGDWMLAPEKVKCSVCYGEFETYHFRDGDDEIQL